MSYLTQILLKNGLGYPGTVLETAEPAYDSSGNLFYIGNGIGNVPTVFYPDVSVGVQGVQGVQGTQGILGAQGAQGTDGAQGLQGIQGITGIQGTDGAQGAQGIQGITGNDGAQGAQGIQGITGNDGAQGIQGITGNDGAQGIQGIQGVQGIQGIQGEGVTPGTYVPIHSETSGDYQSDVTNDAGIFHIVTHNGSDNIDVTIESAELAITSTDASGQVGTISLTPRSFSLLLQNGDEEIAFGGNLNSPEGYYQLSVGNWPINYIDVNPSLYTANTLVPKSYVDAKAEVDQYEFATANYLLPTPSGSGIRFILKNLYTNDISVYCDPGYYVDYRSSKVLLSMNTIDLYDYDVSNWFIV